MKNQQLLAGILLLVSIACSREPAEIHLDLKVTGTTTASGPVSPLLYSHFIEIGFGFQIEPLQAELLFNRSFEPFTPYNGKSKNSFGFLLEGGRYITDWSGEAWYHSGYEHNSWFAAPGDPGNPAIITDTSAFVVPETWMAGIRLHAVPGGAGHGDRAIRVENRDSAKWGGLAQAGKYLEKDKTYIFSGFMKSLQGDGRAELRIYRENDWTDPVFAHSLKLPEEYRRFECTIDFSGETGRCTFALFLPPGSIMEADAFSLLPGDHFHGWRPAVVETVKKLNPGLIRFPGGCFASFYDWRKGVGNHDTRTPEPSYFWGGMNYNDLGTCEFAMLCREVGAEMMLCVNIFTPEKHSYLNSRRNPWQTTDYELPQFTRPEEGIRNALDWLAYCNLAAGEHPMADLRASHGFSEPFGVKYWEMENEPVRWFPAVDYARVVSDYSRAMKALDPTIRIGMVTYDYDGDIPAMLEIAGADIDFLADRDDLEDGRLVRMLDLLREYNASHGTDIRYCNTEWQVHPYGSPNPKEEADPRYLYGHRTAVKRAMVLGTWYCGLKAAGYLMDWQRQGDIVEFVNFNNFSNTHGQAVIESPKEGACLTAPGMVYELFSRTPARRPLVCEGYRPLRTDRLQGQAAWNSNRDTLVLITLNRTDSARTIRFNLENLRFRHRQAGFIMLDADDIYARNKIELPDEIRRTEWTVRTTKDRLTVECPPRSVVEARVY